LLEAVRRFQESALQPAGSWQPQLPLELAFLEIVTAPQAAPTPEPTRSAAAEIRPAEAPAAAPAPQAEPPAPRQPEAAAPAATAPSVAQALTLQTVVGMWHEMVSHVGQLKKNLPALLAMCKPLAVEGNVIILGFDYPIFKEKFDKMQGGPATVTDAFRTLSGVDCNVRGVVTSEYAVPIRRDEFHALAEELGGIVREE
jgi:hypothetical protein